jgi:DNA-directed RNA polymerase subunit H (RpoH/RPB5)
MAPASRKIEWSSEFFTALQVLQKMMETRGWALHFPNKDIAKEVEKLAEHAWPDDAESIQQSLRRLERTLSQTKGMFAHLFDPRSTSWTAVIFPLQDAGFGVAMVREMPEILKDQGKEFKKLFFVSKNNVSSRAKEELYALGYEFETFLFSEIQQDRTVSSQAPKYQVLSDEEKKKELGKKNLASVPELPADDIMARWYGLKEGDVVKFTRVFPGMQPHLYYRRVVAV